MHQHLKKSPSSLTDSLTEQKKFICVVSFHPIRHLTDQYTCACRPYWRLRKPPKWNYWYWYCAPNPLPVASGLGNPNCGTWLDDDHLIAIGLDILYQAKFISRQTNSALLLCFRQLSKNKLSLILFIKRWEIRGLLPCVFQCKLGPNMAVLFLSSQAKNCDGRTFGTTALLDVCMECTKTRTKETLRIRWVCKKGAFFVGFYNKGLA